MIRRMSTVKRATAALGGLVGALVVVAVLGALGLAVRQTGDGADPGDAFTATALDDASLLADTTWEAEPPGLARGVDRATRDELATAWIRADDARARAAASDLDGLGVWHVGPAGEQVRQRFSLDPDGAVRSGAARVAIDRSLAHRLRIDFISEDGQIVVLGASSTVERDGVEQRFDREAIMILLDGTWRIRHLEAT